ncbi:MAG: LysM peptidoglycan-binding domain-containing protein [Anaerolineae bacterium]|nr:LysM peptidoglycan-binding domain-containing protein [Anaerolineae bacterium]
MPKLYTVKAGDTLSGIAWQQCEGRITWRQIAADNNITDPRHIQIGDKLVLNCDPEPPDVGSFPYIVQPGDTLDTIAREQCGGDLTPEKIAADNNIANGSRITVGQELLITCGQGGKRASIPVIDLLDEPPDDQPADQPDEMIYFVKSGDTLSSIASRVCKGLITWERIADDNHIANPNHIAVGQKLVLKFKGASGGEIVRPVKLAKGIDVSHWQGAVRWGTVRANGVEFAFVKATEGDHFTDSRFADNWQGMKDAGIIRGAYHYFRGDKDVNGQVERFLDTVDLTALDIAPVLDVEGQGNEAVSNETMVSGVRTWLEAVAQRTGRTPLIYTAMGYWNAHLTNQFGDYPLWVAHWGIESPALPKGWDDWTFWQYSDSGNLRGISSNVVDFNKFRGSRQDLEDWIAGR